MNYGEIALILVMAAAACGCLFGMFRIQAMRDKLVQELSAAMAECTNAKTIAQQALNTAEAIKVKHFDALRTELQATGVRIDALAGETKASRDLVDDFTRRWRTRLAREAKAEKAMEEEMQTALPMDDQPPAQVAPAYTPQAPTGFGKRRF